MSSEGVVPLSGLRLYRFSTWFDPESAAVLTILMGLFQLFLAVPLAFAAQQLPKFFILPLVLGIIIVAGGSVTMANERNPSRQLLQGCACSNVIGLLGAMLGFCLYIYNLSIVPNEKCVPDPSEYWHDSCPLEILAAYGWSLTVLLLLYDIGAVVLHSLLSLSALKALKSN